LTSKILIELLGQYEDYYYLYSHRVGFGRSIREARFAADAYAARAEDCKRKQAAERLRKSRCVKLHKVGKRVVMELTKKGKIKALQSVIRTSLECFSDDRVCLVSFDFPEAARAARNVFRWFLKGAGFKYLQGSVWTIKKDVSRPMKDLVGLLKIDSWVKIFIVVK